MLSKLSYKYFSFKFLYCIKSIKYSMSCYLSSASINMLSNSMLLSSWISGSCSHNERYTISLSLFLQWVISGTSFSLSESSLQYESKSLCDASPEKKTQSHHINIISHSDRARKSSVLYSQSRTGTFLSCSQGLVDFLAVQVTFQALLVQTSYFLCAEPNWISSTLNRHWRDISFRWSSVCWA